MLFFADDADVEDDTDDADAEGFCSSKKFETIIFKWYTCIVSVYIF